MLKLVVFGSVLIIRVKLLNRAGVGGTMIQGYLGAVGGVDPYRYIGQDTVKRLLKLDELHYLKAVNPYKC